MGGEERIWRSTGRGNPARHAHCTISAKVGRAAAAGRLGALWFFFEGLRVQEYKARLS
jgi:hypothetical protein